MSNLVETNQLQTPQNAWGINQQVGNPQAIQKPETPINVTPSQNEGKFAEYTTHINVTFSGKLKDMKSKCISKAMNQAVAEAVFKAKGGAPIHSVAIPSENGKSDVDLTKAIITGMKVNTTSNGFPFPIKFDWTGQGEASNKFDMEGKQAPLTLYPGEQTRGHNSVVYDARNVVNNPLLKRYGHVSIDDLRAGVQLVNLPDGRTVAYVPKDHEAIKLINMNKGRFGNPPTEADLVHGSMYQMSPQIIGAVIDEMYTNVLSKFNFTDLTKFKVNMYRVDGRDFDDHIGSEYDHLELADREFIASQTKHAGFDLEITWACPRPAAQAKPINVAPSQNNAVVPNIPPHYNTFSNSSAKIPVAIPRTN
jgi:hypothetical protein